MPGFQLPEGINSVYLHVQSNRLFADPQNLIILSFPFDLAKSCVSVGENDRSLVVSKDGNIIAQSSNIIGYRSGFFGDPTEPQKTSLWKLLNGHFMRS